MPGHPTLNYHLGKLLAKDRARSPQAAECLEKAVAGKARLDPAMAQDAEALLKSLGKS